MRQIALDIGITRAPHLDDLLLGPNEQTMEMVRQWLASTQSSPRFMPLYLWGESGSGKTYILQAARAQMQTLGYAFGSMDVGAAEQPFEGQWRAIFFDNAQHYDTAAQQQAFSWLVEAQSAQIPVLIAAVVPPVDLPVREDLRTRMAWGHIAQLRVLTEAQCRAVLRQEADARGILLSDEVLDFILARFSRDLGNLMQLLGRIDRYALYAKRAVTIPLIKSMLESDEGA